MFNKIDEIHQIIADNIVRIRGKMSQKKVSEKSGVSRSTIVKIESGGGCSLENIVKISGALGVEPHVLLSPGGRVSSVSEFFRMLIREEMLKK